MASEILGAERLRELADYDPETGAMTWRRTRGKRSAGKPVGSVMRSGYVRTSIDGASHYVHRLAWLHYYGQWPAAVVDHIDGNKANNCIANLRDVSRAMNQQNRRKPRADSMTGLMGVSLSRNGKWRATIRVDGKDCFLGYHATAEAAAAVYLSAKKRSHPGSTL
jgi:hypothetical protein